MACTFIVALWISWFQQLTGINVVVFYSTTIFKKNGHNPKIPNLLFSIINFSFTIIAGLFVDKLGRKLLLIIGSLLMAISLILVGYLYTT